MTNKKHVALGAAVLLASIFDAGAQTSLIRPSYQFPQAAAANGPANIQLGNSPFFVTPYIGLAAGRDDNVLLSNANRKESTLLLLSPGVTLDARDGNKVFTLDYQAQVGHYTSSGDDDYTDQAARAQFDMALDRRNFLRLGMAYAHGHDPRGSTDRPISNSPDKYRLSAPSFAYAFGSPGAQGRVEVYYDDADRKYLNNRDTTAASDRDVQTYGGAFYWRAMPKTYLLAEARGTRIRYDLPGSLQSGDERRLFAGVSWEATAATTGTIKVGRLKRDFKSDLPSESDATWEGTITWAPRTYSKFDFYAVRTTSEATGQGSFILTNVTGALWSHNWSSFISTGLDLRHEHDAYQNFDRTDNIDSASLRVGYRFRRWLTLGAQYTYTKRDSNVPDAEYNRNLYLLTLTGTL
jgi:hypothetical protein